VVRIDYGGLVVAEDGDVTITIDPGGTCSALEPRACHLGTYRAAWILSPNL
jgi:hypothetical protein